MEFKPAPPKETLALLYPKVSGAEAGTGLCDEI